MGGRFAAESLAGLKRNGWPPCSGITGRHGTEYAQVKAVGLLPLTNLARTLDRHRHGLLAWFKHPISTGRLEGINNKVKVLKRQAYGFRDIKYFELRLYFLHETNLAFPG